MISPELDKKAGDVVTTHLFSVAAALVSPLLGWQLASYWRSKGEAKKAQTAKAISWLVFIAAFFYGSLANGVLGLVMALAPGVFFVFSIFAGMPL